MRIRTAADLGAFIRERRIKLGWDQATLAKAAGTSRKWVVEVEKGKAGAEIGLILKTFKALDVTVDLHAPARATQPSLQGSDGIDQVLASLRKRS